MTQTKTTIRKVKYDGKKVAIEYERERDGGEPDSFSLNCGDRPSPEFLAAMSALAEDANKICQFEPALDLMVRGVSLSWTNDVMGAVITCQRHLTTASSPLILNTPHLPEVPYGEGAGGPVMHDGMAGRLLTLIEEAERYIGGEGRAQVSLFAVADAVEQPAVTH